MGQGSYTMIGFGIENMPTIPEEVNEALGDNDDLNIRIPYEGTSNYLIVPLAVSEGLLQDIWKLPDLSYGDITSLKLKGVEEAKQEWNKVQNWFIVRDIIIPEGKILLVGDYD